MPRQDISNNALLSRVSIEGWIALFVLCSGGIASHAVLANDQEKTAQKVVAIESKQTQIVDNVQAIQIDVAEIKKDIEHLKDQREDIKRIRELLENR